MAEQEQNRDVSSEDEFDSDGPSPSEMTKFNNKLPDPHRDCGCLTCEPWVTEYTVLGSFNVSGTFPEREFWSMVGADVPAEAYVCSEGVIHIKLHTGYHLSITANGCVRLVQQKEKERDINDIVVALSPAAQCATMIHPTAVVVHKEPITKLCIQPEWRDIPPKICFMEEKAIFFGHSGSDLPPVSHVIGFDGVDPFIHKKLIFWTDLGTTCFRTGAWLGPEYVAEAKEIIKPMNVKLWYDTKHNRHYSLEKLGLQICQTRVGGVSVYWGPGQEYICKIAPCASATKIEAPFVRITASTRKCSDTLGADDEFLAPHAFVRKGLSRIHYGGKEVLSVRFNQVSARLDPFGTLIM